MSRSSTGQVRVGVVAVAAMTLLIAGCSTDATSSTPSSGESSRSDSPALRADFNDADVAFVEMMHPHHAQAIEMADLVPPRSQNPEVLGLATRIDRSQYQELWQIIGLLRNFGKPVPDEVASMGEPERMPAMGDMPGMMSAERMNSLIELSGSDFDRTWLSMMIEHHDGAIAMAKAELANGVNPNARGLAEGIIASQQPEIEQMRSVLG